MLSKIFISFILLSSLLFSNEITNSLTSTSKVEDINELVNFLEKDKENKRNQFYLGNLYYFGASDEKGNKIQNKKKGLFYLLKASKNKYPLSNIILGDIFLSLKEIKKSIFFYNRALKYKDLDNVSYLKLANLYFLINNDKKAMFILNKGDKKNIPEVQLKLALLYKDGYKSIKHNSFLADKYLVKLCKNRILMNKKIENFCSFYKKEKQNE